MRDPHRKRFSDDTDSDREGSRCATYSAVCFSFVSFEFAKRHVCSQHNPQYINSHRLGFTQRIRRTISSQLFSFFLLIFLSFVSRFSPPRIDRLCVSATHALEQPNDDDYAHESKGDEHKRRRERVSHRSE